MTRNSRLRALLLSVAACSVLGLGGAAARAEARPAHARGPILDSAQECAQYCSTRGGHSSWDPSTGNCRCW
jgi:hypothetical protein